MEQLIEIVRPEPQRKSDLPPPPPGTKWVRARHYGPSLRDLLRGCNTVAQAEAFRDELIRRCPGSSASRRKLHDQLEAKLAELRIRDAAARAAQSPIVGLDGARLIATPQEARRERR